MERRDDTPRREDRPAPLSTGGGTGERLRPGFSIRPRAADPQWRSGRRGGADRPLRGGPDPPVAALDARTQRRRGSLPGDVPSGPGEDPARRDPRPGTARRVPALPGAEPEHRALPEGRPAGGSG